ncbi:30S ribosome-binding factor RbfA [Phycisphaera mikurensis]|uniref:Ribosome-binding factor A n=1 Tax=Phycisphaera mikurensis (strain NBRC 102666 / KCTC 22515 / FYK2301M01) TaxID=1142394 RepID=I0IE60_PHYMF|nr:30S ribosome-binding factor RbfA [Phycisphaera mikurensis]MBB6441352.1 ribosome-binding factor A [Phycisphaera mikurensis]BAM03548.1 ribosome-binding factor A [Phycisphaera mikurensis NBRC 102666]
MNETHHPRSGDSHRDKKVASVLHKQLSTLLARGIADPRTAGCLISVTEVDVSPDLRHATTYVSVLPAQHENRVIHALRDATIHLQKQLNKKVAFRIVPKLLFKLDRGLKKEVQTLAAISEGMARSGPEPGPEVASDGASPPPPADGSAADPNAPD